MRTQNLEWTNEDTLFRMNHWEITIENEPMRTHNWERTMRKHIEKVPKRTQNWEQTNEDAQLRTNQWEHTMHKCINKCILIKNSYASFGDKLRTCNNLNLINSNCIYKCIDLNWLIQHLQAGFELIIILLVF